ncbi:hypothetical protein ACIAD2193 [Acinetobacter baylyi ADP1]|uniref:Uncharacterized protein n=2 Tax=Acinetobacter baylyi TaxID=202950 RepID=Q6FAC1_ACIAD|nr:hypothetical protein ACIAD2193 [Acinetobacter baylyi ADP1]
MIVMRALMNKYKLFKFESSLSFHELKDRLVDNNNYHDSSFDLKTIRLTDKELCFNFVENKLMETYLLDVYGNQQLIKYLQVDSFEFQIILKDKDIFLLIINAPRSLKIFKQTIAEILDYQISITDIQINPIEWIERLEFSSEHSFEIHSLEIKDIIFNSSTNGSMTIKSQIDLRKTYENNVKSNNYKICKALIINDSYFKGRFILSKDASFQLDCMNSKALIDLLLINL